MSLGSWFTRAIDVITPWDRGGEVQRRQERRRREDEDVWRRATVRRQQSSAPSQGQGQSYQSQPLAPKKTVNIFESLNKNLDFGRPQKTNVVPVFKNQDLPPAQNPAPGEIVKPQQSIINKVRDQFDANTEADKYRRQYGNKYKNEAKPIIYKNPVVNFAKRNLSPTGIFNVGKEIVQGTARLPIETAQTVEQSFRASKEGTRLRKEGYTGKDIDEKAREAAKAKSWSPKGWQARVFGDAPVKSYQEQSKDIASTVQKITGKKPSRVLLTAALLGLNTIPGGILGKETKSGVKLGEGKFDDLAKMVDEFATKNLVEDAGKEAGPRSIPVRQNIPVNDVSGDSLDIPVQVTTPKKPKGPVIRELKGDAMSATPDNAIIERAAQVRRAEAEAVNRVPIDRRIEGVTRRPVEKPFVLGESSVRQGQDGLIDSYATMLRDMGEGNGTQLIPDGEGGKLRTTNNVRFGDTSGKRMTKAMWREEAERQLRAGEAEPSIQGAFNDAADPEVQAMLSKGDRGPELPEGRPIAVKQINGINVVDNTDVPQNLPEIPGTVRVTEQAAPNNTKSAVVAAQTPPSLPSEIQNVLDNPRQFSKRQVASARNQRKLARQMAKTQEDTAEALSRIETVSPAAQSGEGFVPTGEFAKSANGGAYQKASRSAEMQQALQETSQLSPAEVLRSARTNQLDTGGFNRRDIRNIAALFESKRLPRGSMEWKEARQILKEDGTVWGQTGALRNYTMRRTATADELISRYESKIYSLVDDPSKVDSKLFDQVDEVETAYAQARDDALAAYNRFTENPTSENTKLYHAAQDAADKADKVAKRTEYTIATKLLKGNKDVKQMRELAKMGNAADLYQMDAIDASMLSGTGTFVRNFMNAGLGNVEEGIFGRPAAWISRKFTGEGVGGGVMGRGSIEGFGRGAENLRSAAAARASSAGFNPLEHIKNWATTGNELGDTLMDAQAFKNVRSHYTNLLKEQGYSGRELADRASVMARQDPDGLLREYQGAARVAAGLGKGITRNNKVETLVQNVVSDAVSAGKPNAASEMTGKLVARMTIGFPTAIGRSTVEGIKRFTIGAPTFLKAVREADPLKRSILIKEGLKQAGTGAGVIPPMFYALGAADMISGSYPADKETRAQWEREGKTENSIKIGGAWYQLPAYLGAWAVPGLFYASLGRNGGNFGEAAVDAAKVIPGILPTDQASNWMDVINGRTDIGKFMAQTGAAAVRAVTPAGALLNQVAKAFDPTKNDTSSGTNIENFIDKVLGGIPGVNNMANIPDKLADTGKPITNPNPLEIFAGAASDVQGGGEQRSQEIDRGINATLKKIDKYGLLSDPNLNGVLEGSGLEALNKVKNNKQLDESDIKALKEGLVKGVSQEGTDTAYLERGQYDTNLAVLNMKRDLMKEDPTVKPSSLKDIDVAIKRGEIYKKDKIPYEFISAYKDTSLTEWRKMGDPESDDYDQEMYEKLWAMDEKMAKAGVSYKKGSLDKQKYYAKKTGKGRGGRSGGGRGSRGGSRQIDTSFGVLKSPSSAPRVKEYAGIDAKSGSVPIIRRVRPNIVHKITSSG